MSTADSQDKSAGKSPPPTPAQLFAIRCLKSLKNGGEEWCADLPKRMAEGGIFTYCGLLTELAIGSISAKDFIDKYAPPRTANSLKFLTDDLKYVALFSSHESRAKGIEREFNHAIIDGLLGKYNAAKSAGQADEQRLIKMTLWPLVNSLTYSKLAPFNHYDKANRTLEERLGAAFEIFDKAVDNFNYGGDTKFTTYYSDCLKSLSKTVKQDAYGTRDISKIQHIRKSISINKSYSKDPDEPSFAHTIMDNNTQVLDTNLSVIEAHGQIDQRVEYLRNRLEALPKNKTNGITPALKYLRIVYMLSNGLGENEKIYDSAAIAEIINKSITEEQPPGTPISAKAVDTLISYTRRLDKAFPKTPDAAGFGKG